MSDVKQSEVVKGVPYRGGSLKLEYRYYLNKRGENVPRGPYWYFKYVRNGVKSIYIGKCDLETAKLRTDSKAI